MEIQNYRWLMKIHKLQRIQPSKVDSQNNPQESATSSLLELSNDVLPNNPYEHQLLQQINKNKEKKEKYQRKDDQKNSSTYKGRLSVADNFTQSHKMSRKVSAQCISSNETEGMFRKSAINPSRFLLFQNGKLNNSESQDFTTSNLVEAVHKGMHNYKGLKNFTSFIRRRKSSFTRQKQPNIRVEIQTAHSFQMKKFGSTCIKKQKIVQSCQLPDYTEYTSPLKILAPSKIEEIPNIQLLCTSPSFKHKRFLKYKRIMLNNQDKNIKHG